MLGWMVCIFLLLVIGGYFIFIRLKDNKSRRVINKKASVEIEEEEVLILSEREWPQLVTGDQHTIFVDTNNRVWGCGKNVSGELGLPESFYPIPTQINVATEIHSVAVGNLHTILLDFNGRVFTSGAPPQNGRQDSGIFTKNFHLLPNIPLIQSIAAGNHHSLLLSCKGYVYSFGKNEHGQLGLGNSQHRYTPARVSVAEKIVSLAAGYFHTLLLDDKGQVWATGFNSGGQLGLGDLISRHFPQQIAFDQPVKSVHARGKHSAIVVDEENIYTFGDNKYGQLGIELFNRYPKKLTVPRKVQSLPSISTVCLAPRHSFFIDFSGYLWICGGTSSNLGLDYDTQTIPLPKCVGDDLPLMRKISVGGFYTMFVDYDDNLWACGQNKKGQLGLGDTQPRGKPELVSATPQLVVPISVKSARKV